MAFDRARLRICLLLTFALVSLGCSEPGSENQRENQNQPEPGAPPEVVILAGPDSRTSEIDARFELQCLGEAVDCTFRCRLDDSPEEPCGETVHYDGLNDGAHLFEVRAVDANEQESAPVQWSWTVDTVAPEIIDLSGPAPSTHEADATFTFGCSKESCSFQCSLDDAPFQDCASPTTFVGLDDGLRQFAVRPTDDLGNLGAEATYDWTIDSSLPVVTIVFWPPEYTSGTTAELLLQCSKEDCTFQCQLNDEAPEECAAEVTYEDLEDGEYVFVATATDASGVSGPPAQRSWTIDNEAPHVVDLTGPPELTSDPSATFSFACSKDNCTFRCKLEGAATGVVEPLSPCTSGQTYSELADDDYFFSVTAIDLAGNESDAEHFAWTITTIEVDLSGPAQITNDTDAGFLFDCSLSECTYSCALEGATGGTISEPTICTSGQTYFDLADDEYTFSVVATDPTGALTHTETFAWTVDTAPPLINILAAPPLETSADSALFEFECSNKVCTFECALDFDDGTGLVAGAWQSCQSPHLVEELEDGEHTLRLRATDVAGNQSTEALSWTIGPLPPWSMVSGGFSHACGIRDDGSLWCWGSGLDGRLGLGETEVSLMPQQVGEDLNWHTVSVGSGHSCGIRDDGSLWCWGSGSDGRLGLGNTDNHDAPHRVGEDLDWATVSAGDQHTCATREDHSLWCWGAGLYGRLGHGDSLDRSAPHQVGDATTWAKVSAGNIHTCALGLDGSLWCWGFSGSGRLGLGSLVGYRDTPHQVGEATTWATLSLFSSHTCATRDDGSLWCWGPGTFGRLGLGDSINRSSPTQVGDESSWTSVAAGGSHTCAARNDGSLWCWGAGSAGRLGIGGSTDRDTPQQVGEELDWHSLSAGSSFTCAFLGLGDDSLQCWGNNFFGQLGIGTRGGTQLNPVAIAAIDDFHEISAGDQHSCGITSEGSLWCWGRSDDGRLGLGETFSQTAPQQVGEGDLWATLSVGDSHACATRQDGSLWCWGTGNFGKLGLGNTSDRSTPHQVGQDLGWVSVASGQSHTCATRQDGSLWCWGRGANGRLGLGSTTDYSFPQQVGEDSDWTTVVAGGLHTCALRQDGSLWCWGWGGNGRLGLGNTDSHSTPQQVGSEIDWASLSAGTGHTCALRQDDSLWCWGTGNRGRLGLGNSLDRTTPHQVGDQTDWANVSAGDAHTCATRQDGSLWCWGRGEEGQLGLGDTSDRPTPHRIGTALGWDTVSAGGIHNHGLRTSGAGASWGSNQFGQLGDGEAWRGVPTPVIDP